MLAVNTHLHPTTSAEEIHQALKSRSDVSSIDYFKPSSEDPCHIKIGFTFAGSSRQRQLNIFTHSKYNETNCVTLEMQADDQTRSMFEELSSKMNGFFEEKTSTFANV